MAREDSLPARIWLSARVQDRARAESHATLVEEAQRDGGAEFSLYTFSLEWLARWVLSFGSQAEAISPPRLRELVQEELEKTSARYLDPVS